jgi:hypothetical protein
MCTCADGILGQDFLLSQTCVQVSFSFSNSKYVETQVYSQYNVVTMKIMLNATS